MADIICLHVVQYIMDDPRNKTTMNYSLHLKHIGDFSWEQILYSGFVQLIAPPPQAIDPQTTASS